MQEMLKKYIAHGKAFGPIDAGMIQFDEDNISFLKKII